MTWAQLNAIKKDLQDRESKDPRIFKGTFTAFLMQNITEAEQSRGEALRKEKEEGK